MTDDFSIEYEKLQRRMVRQKMHSIWQVAQSGNMDGLKDEEMQIAQVMMEHKEYNKDFNKSGELIDHEYNPESDLYIFMHIGIHMVVENQLKHKEPIEACEFYNAMKERGVSHHEITHYISFILMPLIFDTLKHLKPFDDKRYKSLLRKYKDTDPKRFEALMKKGI